MAGVLRNADCRPKAEDLLVNMVFNGPQWMLLRENECRRLGLKRLRAYSPAPTAAGEQVSRLCAWLAASASRRRLIFRAAGSRQCGQCHSRVQAVKACGGCHSVRYCGRHCQKRAWGAHRDKCEMLQWARRQGLATL